ncbi:MAG: tetratricopeptide repeat protein [Arcticibacter sp.]
MPKRNWRKPTFICMLLICCLGVKGQADNESASKAYKQANDLYKSQNYSPALALYDSLIKVGYRSFELEYNTGNAYYRTGQIAQAILHYERALLLSPNEPDAEHNLRMAYLSTVDKIDPTPVLFYQQWWRDFAYGGTILGKSVWTIILLWLAAIFFASYLFLKNPKIRRWSFYLFSTCLVVGLLSWALVENHDNYMHDNKGAIITTDATYVKGSPTDDGANLFMLHLGTKVTVVDGLETWKKIRLANGNEGWIIASDITEI